MKNSIRFVGLDESKESIEVAVAEAGSRDEVRQYGSIPNHPDALRKLVRRLGRPRDLHFAVEAGPCGYGTYRECRFSPALDPCFSESFPPGVPSAWWT